MRATYLTNSNEPIQIKEINIHTSQSSPVKYIKLKLILFFAKKT